MKAYVIKNEDGEYLQFFDTDSDDIGFTDDLSLAILYDKNEKDIMKKAYSNMEWEYAEITIAEGDLEKENEVLRKALELACNITNLNYLTGYKPEHFIQQAKEQRDEDK